MFKYFHDPAAEVVYRQPVCPKLIKRSHNGKLTGWHLSLNIDITRADNWIESSGQWHYPVIDIQTQEFDKPYSQEDAISFFLMRHSIEAIYENIFQIDEANYATLAAKYNDFAMTISRRK